MQDLTQRRSRQPHKRDRICLRHLVDYFELYPTALAHAAGAHDRPQRAGDATLAADHLAEVVLCDMQAQDDGVVFVDSLNAYRIGLVDELLRQILEELCH